ncbi:Methylisocitrate lyase [Piscirickettsia salmonis]|uniref:Methylisocitrate lyase n=1 Tax=Piscirickettsia salmonis TaxID=1238 RepID=A0A1L6TAL6_PISSA|nr:methylisocitrate lyase [Piscirickettsia salmonis]AKP73575.1 2-methylisocitrate lyase [Piscirickettsia salmonis LF-89 = ATCC VR-1361]ALB22332.1 2-methylisocitrate lyase [Piscirickettsia salmonis]ALY02419.1 2-methylisocitrate lyase [Piscirickettsia salmonis]AMA41936.1 2-methylisocitrate lyase [Piscirickettsia salmonis]AOS34413.1 2-methylisocitrate lyase [Piscirickettsia salmonis]
MKFENILSEGCAAPLVILGAVNAYSAMLARDAGAKALYISGSGVAAASYGLPDLGITSLENVLEDVRRISSAVELPLLVDIDTGWGSVFHIQRTVKEMIKAGVAAIHIEDQIEQKRCGHRANKALVSKEQMIQRLDAVHAANTHNQLFIIARTDAYASEGLDAAIARAQAYVNAGAQAIFAEALTTLAEYEAFCQAVSVPVLANITEFGVTPLFTQQELGEVGVKMVLYPLSAFRAMNQAALAVYQDILNGGSQCASLPQMQTREALYQHLDYYRYEHYFDNQVEC